jgi:hypothetical protein
MVLIDRAWCGHHVHGLTLILRPLEEEISDFVISLGFVGGQRSYLHHTCFFVCNIVLFV